MDEDKKKEIREIAKEVATVVNEDLKSQFKIFGEGLSGVRETVNLIADDMDDVKSDIVDIKSELKDIRGDIKVIKGNIVEINEKLDKKAEKEVVDGHEKRLVSLEDMALPKAA